LPHRRRAAPRGARAAGGAAARAGVGAHYPGDVVAGAALGAGAATATTRVWSRTPAARARARVVGGCSTHNECAIVRARPGDYDRWGVPGWSDTDLAPVVYDVSSALPHLVCRDEDLTAWQRAFLDAAVDAGIPRVVSADEPPEAAGIGPFVQNIADGIRWNAAFAFLDPVRERVTVLDDFLAGRLVFEGDTATALLRTYGHADVVALKEVDALYESESGVPAPVGEPHWRNPRKPSIRRARSSS
jgi:choline dehydrogenase-like flavoprotein